MAWKLVDRIGKTRGLPATEKFVLLAMGHHCNRKTREAWPSVARLQEWTGLGERTVRRALQGLKDKGLLIAARISKGRVSSTYRFDDDAIDAMANPATRTGLETNLATAAAQPGHTGRQPGHSGTQTLKEPGSEPCADARAREGARPPAPQPATLPASGPGPKQLAMLLPIRGSAPRRETPEERLAAARAALDAMPADHPMREAQGIVVKRIEREIAEASAPTAERRA